MKKQPNIRLAKLKDINQIIDLCEAHAHYEKAVYSRGGKSEQLAQDLFSKVPKLYCLVVENEGQLIGYATYMTQYSTWEANQYIYMDCLFLNESVRDFGIGEKLVRKIQEKGRTLGCDLVQWQTPSFNTRAIKFYNRIGSNQKNKERFFLNI